MVNSMRLRDKVVVITGAGRGIGRAMACAHAAEGAKVAALARSQIELDSVVSEIRAANGTAMAVSVDLIDSAATDDAINLIAENLGPIDILINNAGRLHAIGPIWEVPADDWWCDVEVNLRTAANACHAVLPSMVARRVGRIINLIGAGTAGPLPSASAYGVAKTGILRLTESLAEAVVGNGISVLAMAPGLVRTAMTEYQLESAAGQKYMAGVADRFASGDFLPPERAATLSVEIASGRYDRLSGRALSARDNFDTLDKMVDEIVATNQRTLHLPGLGPTMKPTN